MKNILIISYVFPPTPGIGGRRWAKFAKYLHRLGHSVHVIASKDSNQLAAENTSPWLNDIEPLPAESIFYVNSHYPLILCRETVNSFWSRLTYRWHLMRVRFKTHGTPYDRAVFCVDDMMLKAEEWIVKYNIKHVVLTGAPFSVLYRGLALKKKFKHIKIYSDIRDPWTWTSSYGMKSISSKRLAFEQKMEKKVLLNSDMITVPSRVMKEHLQKVYPIVKDKVHLLCHGYDQEELPTTMHFTSDFPKARIRFIYGGTMYLELDQEFERFRNFCAMHMSASYEIHFYTFGQKYFTSEEIETFEGKIKFFPPVSAIEFNRRVKASDYYLVFCPRRYKDFITAKYYELLLVGVPVVLVAEEGDLSRFIEEHKMGWRIDPANLEEDLARLVASNPKSRFNQPIVPDEFDYQNLTNRFLDLIEKHS